jgi:hypothetical protein
MQYLVIQNYKNYANRNILDWTIEKCVDYPIAYSIILKKDNSEKLFYINRTIIKGSDLSLPNDVYELRYKNFEDCLLLSETDVLDIDIVISKMQELIQKYSSYE